MDSDTAEWKFDMNSNAIGVTRELAEPKPKPNYMLQSIAVVKRVRSHNSLETLSESSEPRPRRSFDTDRYLIWKFCYGVSED